MEKQHMLIFPNGGEETKKNRQHYLKANFETIFSSMKKCSKTFFLQKNNRRKKNNMEKSSKFAVSFLCRKKNRKEKNEHSKKKGGISNFSFC